MIQLINVTDTLNPDALLFALNQLKFHPDMVPIVDYLRNNLNGFRKLNDSASGDILIQQQGACQFISEFLTKIDESQEIRQRKDSS